MDGGLASLRAKPRKGSTMTLTLRAVSLNDQPLTQPLWTPVDGARAP